MSASVVPGFEAIGVRVWDSCGSILRRPLMALAAGPLFAANALRRRSFFFASRAARFLPACLPDCTVDDVDSPVGSRVDEDLGPHSSSWTSV